MERARISLLTVCGLEELEGQSDRRVTHVLSILDPDWPDPESFSRWDRHHRLTLRFHDIVEPTEGQTLPERSDVERILAFGHDIAAEADSRQTGHLLVHCHLGISRSSAAMTMLMAQADPDESEEQVLVRLGAATR